MSNETELDWLARNVNAWPDTALVSVFNPQRFVLDPFDGELYFTHSQWLALRAELQNKPSWEDAPEWARYLVQINTGAWVWTDSEDLAIEFGGSDKLEFSGSIGIVLGEWRDTLEKRPEHNHAEMEADLVKVVFEAFTSIEDNQGLTMIKQTEAQQDNGWFERGELPPAGVWCEAYCDGAEPEKCKILAYHKRQVAVQWSKFNQGCLDVLEMDGWSFRPTRTDRDKAIECMMKDSGALPCETTESIMLNLYDAGYRKEEK